MGVGRKSAEDLLAEGSEPVGASSERRHCRCAALGVVALLLLIAAPGAAGRVVLVYDSSRIDTIERATFDADVIVRGVATEIREERNDDGIYTFVVCVKVAETLKGPPAEVVTFHTAYGANDAWDKVEHLYFLVTSARYAALWPATTRREAARVAAQAWAMLPLSRAYPAPLAGRVSNPVCDGAFTPLPLPAELLDDVRREVRDPPVVQYGSVDLTVSLRTKAFTLPPGGPPEVRDPLSSLSTVFGVPVEEGDVTFHLNVLVDARAEARAVTWLASADPFDRSNALKVLSHFRSAENVARVAALLGDPLAVGAEGWPPKRFVHLGSATPRQARQFPLRREAYELLKEWRAAPAEAVLFEPKYAATYLPSWAPVGALVGLLVTIGAVVLLGRVGRARRVGGVTAASAVMLVLTVGLWLRSQWRIDQIAYGPAAGVRCEVASFDGTVRLTRIEKWDEPTPAAFTRAARTAESQADWALGTASWVAPPAPPPTHAGMWGFAADSGTLGDMYGAGQPYRAYVAPWWAVGAPFAVLLAGRLYFAIRRRWGRRRDPNACGACGYDLRATPDRCPECGAAPNRTTFCPNRDGRVV